MTAPPVGLCSPLSVAVSLIAPPMTIDCEALLCSAGDALAIVTVSSASLHAPSALALFASPA